MFSNAAVIRFSAKNAYSVHLANAVSNPLINRIWYNRVSKIFVGSILHFVCLLRLLSGIVGHLPPPHICLPGYSPHRTIAFAPCHPFIWRGELSYWWVICGFVFCPVCLAASCSTRSPTRTTRWPRQKWFATCGKSVKDCNTCMNRTLFILTSRSAAYTFTSYNPLGRLQKTVFGSGPDPYHYSSCLSCSVFFVGLASAYLADVLHLVTDLPGRPRLRSASSLVVAVPSTRLRTIGDRAFPAAASRTWNSLPPEVTSSTTLSTFKSKLKTYIFSLSFPDL